MHGNRREAKFRRHITPAREFTACREILRERRILMAHRLRKCAPQQQPRRAEIVRSRMHPRHRHKQRRCRHRHTLHHREGEKIPGHRRFPKCKPSTSQHLGPARETREPRVPRKHILRLSARTIRIEQSHPFQHAVRRWPSALRGTLRDHQPKIRTVRTDGNCVQRIECLLGNVRATQQRPANAPRRFHILIRTGMPQPHESGRLFPGGPRRIQLALPFLRDPETRRAVIKEFKIRTRQPWLLPHQISHALLHPAPENPRWRASGNRQQLCPHLHLRARLRRLRSRRHEHTARKRALPLQRQHLRHRHRSLHRTAAREAVERDQRIIRLAVLAEKFRQHRVARRARAVPHLDRLGKFSTLLDHARQCQP